MHTGNNQKMVELAEGFSLEVKGNHLKHDKTGCFDFTDRVMNNDLLFPLLVHRAVEGWNAGENTPYYIQIDPLFVGGIEMSKEFWENKCQKVMNDLVKQIEINVKLEAENSEYRKIYSILTDDIKNLTLQKSELLEFIKNVNLYESQDRKRKILLKKYEVKKCGTK
jgi:hypothetical protein